ncbi:acyl-CoA dehydrogenase family protein [Mycobacterium sp. NAZ190054]|uniref:acyl-CoA dehydrogenase family protein n=1 Tax=Mycobacterium sp. NAZ190054 TaxID=1747766 RepID=UPI000798666F|nr:acyl-CoA dehydrogenase family protein [Mycobacterium sp. NAZ190054]KWX57518.1 acyl-CoA dehydrogenase [Mycobacterium sp. NAZ190054]
MDFSISPAAKNLLDEVRAFMNDRVYPAEPVYRAQREELAAQGRPHDVPQILHDLIGAARERGMWNLFRTTGASELTNVDYALLAEETGKSPFIAPAAMNCMSPDSGNMEMLERWATPRQRQDWLEPLLDGSIRSGFSMTEPAVASSDALNISTTMRREGDEYVINGHKWFTTGAADPRCKILIVLAKSNPDAAEHRRHSMVLVPVDTPGVHIKRVLPVYGFREQQGHCEIVYDDVRVPVTNLLGAEGEGFVVAQSRLGPGRVHHCMRAIGMAERALEAMCRRALSRTAFGGPLADQGTIRAHIAESRMEIDQARALVLRTAAMIDRQGVKKSRIEISKIKVLTPRVACAVLDRAIQVHGAAGVTDDFPLAEIWSRARTLRIVDGPDEVHIRAVARDELRRYAEPAPAKH